jgi:hypothetical protein
MNKQNKTKKGFSIGEVMIAMFILITGIIGAVFLSAKSTGQIGDSRNAIIAASLAQEGVELVRNIRDNSVTQETCGAGDERCGAFDPDTDYGWPSGNEYGCTVSYELKTVSSGVGMNCTSSVGLRQLYLDTDEEFYTHESGNSYVTPFKRVVFVDYFDEDGNSVNNTSSYYGNSPIKNPKDLSAKITSVVTWSESGIELDNASEVEANCKIGKQCAYAQTVLTSWINYGE